MKKSTSTKSKKEDINLKDLKGQLVRALADYDNLRKRTEVEKEVWIKFAAERVLIRILPVLDMLESASNHLHDAGLQLAVQELKKVLFEEDLEEIYPEKGDVFDPKVHEAVETAQGGKKEKVAQLVLVGWKFKDGPVIRHAKVRVYN
ncbi:nucleotide exchange factor GrpE [Patescibacteria group bacterium]